VTRKTKSDSPRVEAGTRLAKSFAHGTRIDILRILNERTASPKELAEAVDDGLSQVSYHVSELLSHGVIELVRTEPRRGALEHYYRAVASPVVSDAETATLPRATREELSTTALQAILGEAVSALQSRSFDARVDRHVSWLPLRLDEKGWGELTAVLADTLGKVERIKEKNARRLADDDGVEVIVSMMGFERSKSRGTGS
jgi:DNA-binding transcriptional ArsR family regulator